MISKSNKPVDWHSFPGPIVHSRLGPWLVAVWFLLISGVPIGSLVGQTVPPTGEPWPPIPGAEQVRKSLMKAELRSRIEALEERQQMFRNKYQELQDQTTGVQTEIDSAIARQRELPIAPVVADEVARMLQSRRIELMIDLAGLEARQTAILQAMEKLEQDETAAEADLLRAKLAEMVVAAQQKFEQTQRLAERGAVSSSDLLDARKSLLSAEIQLLSLAESRSAAKESLQAQLTELMLERAETVARLERVRELLPDVEAAWQAADTVRKHQLAMEQLQGERQLILQEMENIETELVSWRRQLEGMTFRPHRDQDNGHHDLVDPLEEPVLLPPRSQREQDDDRDDY